MGIYFGNKPKAPKRKTLGAFLRSYLIRLISYISFFIYLWNIFSNEKLRENSLRLLIIVSILVAIFGWLQYLFFPDLRVLKYVGWDDHLYRLTGSFLDPGFSAIILVLGFLV
ncbi:MAG: hypothetical protein AAB503_01210, partial [Patescibacteria group bacterium]